MKTVYCDDEVMMMRRRRKKKTTKGTDDGKDFCGDEVM